MGKKERIYDKIIIIQGESVNKNLIRESNMPFLEQLKNKKYLYSFNNVISPANLTRKSIPMLFTDANVKKWKYNFIHSFSLLTDFHFFGYETLWISNQRKNGVDNDNISSVATEADYYYFLQKNFSKLQTDYQIVKFIEDESIIKQNKKQFFVFHLIGSHFSYRCRYDKRKILIKNPSDIKEEYINTLYYTDYVIKKIFEMFNYEKTKEKILIVFLSDHSAVINKHNSEHGFLPSYKDEYEIPFVIYRDIRNKRIEKIYQQNATNVFNMENFNYLLKFITYMSDDANISSSTKVKAIDEIVDYKMLRYF